MLNVSAAHDVSGFTSPESSSVKYDPTAHRIFATNGKTIIAVPIDGEDKTGFEVSAEMLSTSINSSKDGKVEIKNAGGKLMIAGKAAPKPKSAFPTNIEKVFPTERPQTIIALDAVQLRAIADYVETYAVDGDATLYLGLNHSVASKATAGMEKVDDAILFFCVVEDNGTSKLVSGVLLPELIEETDFAKVAGLSDVARKPRQAYTPSDDEAPDIDARLKHQMASLKKAGYVIGEPGSKIGSAAPAAKFNPNSIGAIDELRDALLDSDIVEFNRLVGLGVKADRLDSEDNPILAYAVSQSTSIDTLPEFLKNPELAKSINKSDWAGCTPFVYALVNDHAGIPEMLVKHGASKESALAVIQSEWFASTYGKFVEHAMKKIEQLFPKSAKAGKKPAKVAVK